MSEYDKFMDTIKNKSDSTKKQYRLQYNKLFKLTGKPIEETSEKKIIELLDEIDNKNNSQALLNIALLIRKMNNLSVTRLENRRKTDKNKLIDSVKEKNLELKENLPSYDDIVEYMNYLYDKSEWTDYIINYLLINLQVRNQDLDFTIVSKKKDAVDSKTNYMWLQNTKGKATFIRNVYKTASVNAPDGTNHGYGQKVNNITEKKFIVALRRVLGCQKSGLDCGTFIPTKSAIAYHIIKSTYKQLGESKYMKIVVNHFRNNIDKLKEISANRGTDLRTILSSYDIDMK
tara:strand:+ start:3630 stop:4493 length:864 start_codon:yes stop_codon:yes gene_type:complete